MTENFTPLMRAFVVAALLLATATLMLVAVNTARAAGALALDVGQPCGAHGWAQTTALAHARMGRCAPAIAGGAGEGIIPIFGDGGCG
jgi:hypothetical protein